MTDHGWGAEDSDRVMYHVLDTTDLVLDAARHGDFARARTLVQRTEGLARLLLLRHWAWLLADFAPPWTRVAHRRPDLPFRAAEPITQLVGFMQDRHEELVALVLVDVAAWPADKQTELAIEMVGGLLVGLPAAVPPRRYVLARERLARAEADHAGKLTRTVSEETALVAALTRLVAAYWLDPDLPAQQVAGALTRTLAGGFPGNPPNQDLQRTAVAVLARAIAATRTPGQPIVGCHPAGRPPAPANEDTTPAMGDDHRSTMLAVRVIDHATNGQSQRIIPELQHHADDPSILARVLATTAHAAAEEISTTTAGA